MPHQKNNEQVLYKYIISIVVVQKEKNTQLINKRKKEKIPAIALGHGDALREGTLSSKFQSKQPTRYTMKKLKHQVL